MLSKSLLSCSFIVAEEFPSSLSLPVRFNESTDTTDLTDGDFLSSPPGFKLSFISLNSYSSTLSCSLLWLWFSCSTSFFSGVMTIVDFGLSIGFCSFSDVPLALLLLWLGGCLNCWHSRKASRNSFRSTNESWFMSIMRQFSNIWSTLQLGR